MGLERFGMATGHNLPGGQSVLGAMWLAAAPDEYPMGRAMLQNLPRASNSNFVSEAQGEALECEREPKFEPTSKNEKQEPTFRKIKVFGVSEVQENPFGRGSHDGMGHSKEICHAGKRDAKDDADGEPKSLKVRKRVKDKRANDVTKLLQDSRWIARAKENLKNKLFSTSTIATRNAKRKKVMEIIDSCGYSTLFTKHQEVGVTPDQLLTVAAVLGEMKLKSADAYLSEVKLIQLEFGISWSDVLERQLTMLKRALRRDRGPEVRAVEVKLAEIPEKLWNLRSTEEGVQERVVMSFAWATVWMLRAIEAAQVRVADVSLNHKDKIVYLWIRKSKTDQKALGVKRALRCCNLEECPRYCPWRMAKEIFADAPNRQGFLFPDVFKCHVPKVKMVKAWMDEICPDMSGHSARRSGAMMYARAGMHVHEIAMLGRWKSSCVFRYIEEAMQDVPLNQNVRAPMQKSQCSTWAAPAEHTEPKTPAQKPSRKIQEVVTEVDVKPVVPDEIWVVSTARKGRISHRVRQASWDLRLSQWDTWCGWHFADRNVKVTMTNKFQQGTDKCKKCEMAKSSRDFVKGSVSLAQLVSLKNGSRDPKEDEAKTTSVMPANS